MSLTLASGAPCFNCCHCKEAFAVLKRLRIIKIKVYSWFCHGLSCSACHVLPCFIRLSCACHALPSFVKVRAKQIMEISLGRWHGPSAYRTKQGIQNPLYRIDQIREKCQKGPKNKSLKCIFLSLFLTTWRISIYTMQIHAVLCSESWVRIGGYVHLVILLSDAPPSHQLLSRCLVLSLSFITYRM